LDGAGENRLDNAPRSRLLSEVNKKENHYDH